MAANGIPIAAKIAATRQQRPRSVSGGMETGQPSHENNEPKMRSPLIVLGGYWPVC